MLLSPHGDVKLMVILLLGYSHRVVVNSAFDVSEVCTLPTHIDPEDGEPDTPERRTHCPHTLGAKIQEELACNYKLQHR